MTTRMVLLVQWVNDWRWSANMRRIRAFRRKLTSSERRLFDEKLRNNRVPYPAMIYSVTVEDFVRAVRVVRDRRYQLDAYGDPEDH